MTATETRRALLAKAGVAAGAAGLATTLARPDAALAATREELKFDGYNNVKDFGAVGDGTADDTASIQDCIEQSAGIASVYFPPGTYKITTPIKVVSQTRLVGHGAMSVIKADPPTTLATMVNTWDNGVSGWDDITIEDLTFDANGKSTAFAIKIAAPESDPNRRVYLRRLEVKGGMPSFALILRNIAVGAVEECYIHDGLRDGINLAAGRDFIISDNVVEDCNDDHIVAWGQNVLICGNVCDARTTRAGAGITVYGPATVVGNVTYGGVHAGIEVRLGGQDTLIAGNAVLEAGNTDGTSTTSGNISWGLPRGSGISVLLQTGSTVGITRLSIRDNFVLSPRNHGILIASSASPAISDVAIDGNTIWMAPPAVVRQPDATLAGSGVIVSGNADNAPPSGPVENVRVSSNDIRRAKGPGIVVQGAANKRWDVKGNTVLDSGTGNASPQPGIVIDGFGGFAVNDNRSQDTRTTGKTQSHGLRLANTTGANLVTNNDFSGNASGGISRTNVNATTHVFENLGDDLT